ncbi:MAG: GxxExxY protein [Planctomycetaceae bacterium]|nr:GxxExxY protein [Planctomycetaceae bacterium]
MPVKVHAESRVLSEGEFAELAYEVMGHVFAIHREFGRFFDESIYKRELARRMTGVELEVPVEVRFDPFRAWHRLDVLVRGGAVFEFKAVEAIVDRHRSQLLNYLLLTGLTRGKLVNVRSEQVQHEFVNSVLDRTDRTQFSVDRATWDIRDNDSLLQWVVALLRDLGTGLDVSLYEDAITQFLGGREVVEKQVPIYAGDHCLGTQPFRLVRPTSAIKVTAFNDDLAGFEAHARRLLSHTRLESIEWINVARHCVTFRTLHQSQSAPPHFPVPHFPVAPTDSTAAFCRRGSASS